MKKYINYINAIVGCCLLAACNELDTQPFESYDEDTVWGSTESAASFVINSYNGTVTNFVGYAYMESLTPNSIHSDLTTLDGFPIERVDRFTSTAQGLDNYFANLRNCNLIIEKAPSQALKAEGYLLRGLLFFNQTRWQGRFVPILRVLNTKSNEAFRTPYTQNPTESYRYIMSDLTKAAEEMPETSAPGRANKYVAHAFRSRIALQAYAYTKDAQYLDIAIASANAVINSGKYTLASADNFGNMFLPAGQNDREIILCHYRLKLNTSVANFNEMIRVVPNINNNEVRAVGGRLFTDAKGRTFEGWASYFPTQDLIDQYLVVDQNDHTAKPWYETSQFLNNVEDGNIANLTEGSLNTIRHKVPEAADLGTNAKGNIITRYGKIKSSATETNISNLMYQHRDARFYHTIVYDQSSWLNEEVETNICGNLWAGVREGQSDSWYTTASGYYWRKAVTQVEPRVYADNKLDYHFVVIRLGEMYMNLAEAYLLKGDIGQAVTALNKTRVVHGNLPASTAGTLADAWKDYIRERSVEMAYEGDLYWSYLRWGQYGGDANGGAAAGAVVKALNTPVHKIQITKDRKQFFIAQITRNGAWERTFTTKRYLMPIPQGTLDKRAASGINDAQNEGW